MELPEQPKYDNENWLRILDRTIEIGKADLEIPKEEGPGILSTTDKLLSDLGTISMALFAPIGAIAALFGITIWRQSR